LDTYNGEDFVEEITFLGGPHFEDKKGCSGRQIVVQ